MEDSRLRASELTCRPSVDEDTRNRLRCRQQSEEREKKRGHLARSVWRESTVEVERQEDEEAC